MDKITSPFLHPEQYSEFWDDRRKGLHKSPDMGCCVFKKCCKKYKRGKRCKKCPNG